MNLQKSQEVNLLLLIESSDLIRAHTLCSPSSFLQWDPSIYIHIFKYLYTHIQA